MRKTLFASALLALLLLGSQSGAAPLLNLPETRFDFGYCPQNSQVTHTFVLHNSGDDSLIITNVLPGCGCTKAPLESDRLAAGDSTRLEIIFSTKHYTNRVSKHPRIETNEGPPHKNVMITADVLSRPDSTYPIVIKPYRIDISQFGDKTRDETKILIENVSDQPLRPALVSWSSDLMNIDLPQEIAPGQRGEVALRLTPKGVQMNFEKSFTIELNDDQHSRFTVPVKRTIKNPNAMTAVSQGRDN